MRIFPTSCGIHLRTHSPLILTYLFQTNWYIHWPTHQHWWICTWLLYNSLMCGGCLDTSTNLGGLLWKPLDLYIMAWVVQPNTMSWIVKGCYCIGTIVEYVLSSIIFFFSYHPMPWVLGRGDYIMYTCAYAHVVIMNTWHWHAGWSMYPIDTQLHCVFMKIAFWWLSLVKSGIWPLSFVFAEPLVAQHYLYWEILALMELPRWLMICVDIGIPTSGCTLRFNPWYKSFISSLRSCENQPPCSWMIVKLLSLLWVKNCKWSNWTPFLLSTVFHWAALCWSMAKPAALVILCESCSWMNVYGGH